jgi:hypothetical protein
MERLKIVIRKFLIAFLGNRSCCSSNDIDFKNEVVNPFRFRLNCCGARARTKNAYVHYVFIFEKVRAGTAAFPS